MGVTVAIEDRIQFATEYLKLALQIAAPIDTGNLSLNAIRIVNNGVIKIGGEIAPYAVYTNEKWVDEKWGGKKNPNEGWIQKAIESAKPMIGKLLGGVYSQEDIEKILSSQGTGLSNKLKERIKEIESE